MTASMARPSRGNRHARLRLEHRRNRLERRYRRLLILYPKDHRREHAEEMIGVLLASACSNDSFGSQARPARIVQHAADTADLVVGAARIRRRLIAKRVRDPRWLGSVLGMTVRDTRWSDALAVASVVTPLLLLVAALAQFSIPQAAASAVTGHPYWPLASGFFISDWPLTAGAPAVVMLAFLRLRRIAGLAALATAVGELVMVPVSGFSGYASPAVAFTVMLAGTAAVALLLSPGPARGLVLLRWWGTLLIAGSPSSSAASA